MSQMEPSKIVSGVFWGDWLWILIIIKEVKPGGVEGWEAVYGLFVLLEMKAILSLWMPWRWVERFEVGLGFIFIAIFVWLIIDDVLLMNDVMNDFILINYLLLFNAF